MQCCVLTREIAIDPICGEVLCRPLAQVVCKLLQVVICFV